MASRQGWRAGAAREEAVGHGTGGWRARRRGGWMQAASRGRCGGARTGNRCCNVVHVPLVNMRPGCDRRGGGGRDGRA